MAAAHRYPAAIFNILLCLSSIKKQVNYWSTANSERIQDTHPYGILPTLTSLADSVKYSAKEPRGQRNNKWLERTRSVSCTIMISQNTN